MMACVVTVTDATPAYPVGIFSAVPTVDEARDSAAGNSYHV